jgi:hypothetical protein
MKRRAFLASLAGVVGAASNWPAPRRVTPPSPGHLQLHPGSPPPGAVDDRILWDLTRDPGGFGGVPGGPQEVVAWGKALEWTVLLAARPPQPGENWLWWSTGLLEADGAYSVGSCGGPGMPLQPLQASGSHNLRVGGSTGVRSPAWSPSGWPGCGCCSTWGSPSLTWCRSRSGTAFRSTSTPASTSSPGRMSGPALGRSSGCSASTSGAARSQSASWWRHSRRCSEVDEAGRQACGCTCISVLGQTTRRRLPIAGRLRASDRNRMLEALERANHAGLTKHGGNHSGNPGADTRRYGTAPDEIGPAAEQPGWVWAGPVGRHRSDS